ncbi:hypothetical protein D1872_219640 [compost metagenome]
MAYVRSHGIPQAWNLGLSCAFPRIETAVLSNRNQPQQLKSEPGETKAVIEHHNAE